VKRELGIPVRLIGLGEGADDLTDFNRELFVDALLDNNETEEDDE
jgi:fused signal recognition particle receptor